MAQKSRFSQILGFAMALLLALIFGASQAQAQQSFTLESYFTGKTYATGQFSAINGAKRQFEVELNGTWDGQVLTLREDFIFNDGSRDTKTWHFTKTSQNTYEGTREDVIGSTKIVIENNIARFNYLVYLDPDARKLKVRFHDEMRLNPDGTLLNEARITKFLFPIGKTRVEFWQNK